MPGEERQSYYARARDWAEDRAAADRGGMRTGWLVAAGTGAIALVEGLALLALMPLKTVVPYTVLVDRNTGFVQALDGTGTPAIRADAALTQSLLAQYVIARESFDIADVSNQYRKVSLWSADAARRDYLALMEQTNPEGPLVRYGRSAQVSVEVESVSALAPDRALVRFVTRRLDSGGGARAARPSYWVALLRYRYVDNPAKLEDRLVNPLGFQVIEYRRDQEAPPVVADAADAPALPAATASSPPSVAPGQPALSPPALSPPALSPPAHATPGAHGGAQTP